MRKISNETKYYMHFTFFNLALSFLSGAVIQTFLLEYGVKQHLVSVYTAVLQIVQVLTMLLLSPGIEKIRRVKSTTAFCALLSGIPLAVLLIFSIKRDFPAATVFAAVFAVSIFANIFLALYNVLSYKLPYFIIDMKDYGKITAKSSAIHNTFGMACSALLTYTLKEFEYFNVMSCFFFAGILMMVIMYAATVTMRTINPSIAVTGEEEKKSVNIFADRSICLFLAGNFLRGIFTGVFLLSATIGYYYGIISGETSGWLVFLTNIAFVIGNIAFTKISSAGRYGKIILLSSVGMAIFAPCMLAGNSRVIFLIMYTLCNFLLCFVNTAVPVSATQIVDYNIMGRFSAWRMLLYTLGMALGSFVCTPLLESIGGVAMLALSGLPIAACGIIYYEVLKKKTCVKIFN